MLSKEAKNKYRITKQGYHQWAIGEVDWHKMVDDHQTSAQMNKKTGASLGWMGQQRQKYNYGCSISTVPLAYRPDGLYGKLKYQELKEQQVEVEAKYANYTGPIYAIACLHSVFVDFDYLMEFLEREKEGLKKGIILIVGDIFDWYNLSLFPKEYADITVDQEITVVMQLLFIIKKYCPNIILVKGNHDVRKDKRRAEQQNKELDLIESKGNEAIEHLCKRKGIKVPVIDNILLLAKGSILSYLSEMVGCGEMKLWHCRIGHTVFCHPERGVGTPLQTAIRAYMYFSIRQKDADSVVVFHTHMASSAIYRGWFIAEGGCMARLMDYQNQPNLRSGSADLPYVAYFKGEMTDGYLDKTRAVINCLGECK
jgi:hypothetical protein